MVSKKKRATVKFSFFILAIILVVFLSNRFDLASILSPSHLREMVLSYGMAAPIIFMLIYIAATVFFLPGTPISLAGGLIFGKVFGGLYILVGATLGATAAFLVTRFFGKSFIGNLLEGGKYKKLSEYDEKLEKNGFQAVFLLRLLPIFPFNGLNFALGLTKVKTSDYMLGTLLGIIPGVFILTFIGESIGDLNPVKIILGVILFAILALAPSLVKKIKKRKSNARKK